MLGLSDLKQTRVYQEALEEEARSLVLRILTRKLGEIPQLESGNYRSNFSPLLLPHEQAATYPEH